MSSRRQTPRRRSAGNTRDDKWPEKMKVSLARKFLGVSESKISNLLSTGVLPFERDYLDNRVKLVKRADLESLLQKHKQK